jgi:polyferredoxin
MNKIESLEKRISKIELRDKRVETDKAWETSWTRRMIIALLTYLVVGVYFELVLKVSNSWFNALVPPLGFLLSTLTLEAFKRIWAKYTHK